EVANQENDIWYVGRLLACAADACGHALHCEQILGHRHRKTKMRELRKIARGDLVVCGKETFHTVVQPVGREVLLFTDATGDFADKWRRLKERIHIFGR